MEKLKHIWYWLTNARKQPSGLLELTPDDRDIDIKSILGWGWGAAYVPATPSKTLGPIFVKNQRGRSNCSFQTWANVLSVACGEEVSARYLTAKAYQQGLCQREGWADLRSGAKVANKFGFCLESECPSNETLSWDQYVTIDFATLDKLAEERKIGSYYRINNSDDYLRAIDSGHAVALGRTWLSGMNQGGGFRAPWILKREGYTVSGHATCGAGQNQNYQGVKVDIEPNSYGTDWGDHGYFYCPLSDLNGDISRFGAYAVTDIIYSPKITAERIISEYEGKNVRGDKKGAIYLIYDGQKFSYKNADAFVSVNGYSYEQKGAFILVPQEAIDGVPFYGGSEQASILDGSLGNYATMVKNLKKPINSNFDNNIEINQ